MNTERTTVGWGFWLAWVLASIAGFVMGTFLGGVAYGLFDGDESVALYTTYGLVMGAMGGFVQWMVLREKVAKAGWWVLASALGFAIALGTLGIIGINDNEVLAGLLFAAIFGIVTGIMQWLVLRQQLIRAGVWVPASLFGALVASTGFPISLTIGWTTNYLLAAMVFGLLFGVGVGAIPGAVLVWLLRQSPSSNIEGMATAH